MGNPGTILRNEFKGEKGTGRAGGSLQEERLVGETGILGGKRDRKGSFLAPTINVHRNREEEN